jgi:hypothetical protein
MFETAINARCRRSRKRALSPQINSLAHSGFLVPDISGASHLIRAGYPLDALGSVSPPAFGGGKVRPKEAQMLGKLSIAGAVAAILMNPTARSVQVGGAVNPGAAVRGRSGAPDPAVQTSRPLSPHQNGGEAFLHVRLPFIPVLLRLALHRPHVPVLELEPVAGCDRSGSANPAASARCLPALMRDGRRSDPYNLPIPPHNSLATATPI